MTLSEAARLGAAMTPQAFKTIRDDRGGTCFYGAVALAAGRGSAEIMWHQSAAASCFCPVCGPAFNRGQAEITIHLNDYHRWSRERIADWVVSRGLDYEVTPEVLGDDYDSRGGVLGPRTVHRVPCGSALVA